MFDRLAADEVLRLEWGGGPKTGYFRGEARDGKLRPLLARGLGAIRLLFPDKLFPKKTWTRHATRLGELLQDPDLPRKLASGTGRIRNIEAALASVDWDGLETWLRDVAADKPSAAGGP